MIEMLQSHSSQPPLTFEPQGEKLALLSAIPRPQTYGEDVTGQCELIDGAFRQITAQPERALHYRVFPLEGVTVLYDLRGHLFVLWGEEHLPAPWVPDPTIRAPHFPGD